MSCFRFTSSMGRQVVGSVPVVQQESDFETTFDAQFVSYAHIGEINQTLYTRPSVTRPTTKPAGVTAAPSYVSTSQFKERVYTPTLVADTPNPIDTSLRHPYSKWQFWNCDETLVVFIASNGWWYLYDADTFTRLDGGYVGGDHDESLPSIGSDNCDLSWHPTDPHIIRFNSNPVGLVLYEINVLTGAVTPARTFVGRLAAHGMGTAVSVDMGGEGRPPKDGRYYCFRVRASGGGGLGVITYDYDNDLILGSNTSSNVPNWTGMTNDGSKFIVQWHNFAGRTLAANAAASFATRDGTVAFNAALSSGEQLDTDGEHGDVGEAADGSQEWLSVPFSGRNESTEGTVYIRSCADGATHEYTGVTDYVGNDLANHFNGTAYDRPGWMFMDFHGGGSLAAWKDGALCAVEVQAPYRFARVGFHYSDGGVFGSPYMASNRGATRFLFGSFADPQEVRMLVLPSDWPDRLPAS